MNLPVRFTKQSKQLQEILKQYLQKLVVLFPKNLEQLRLSSHL